MYVCMYVCMYVYVYISMRVLSVMFFIYTCIGKYVHLQTK